MKSNSSILVKLLFAFLCISLVFSSCKNKTDDPKVEAPSNLIYTPNSLTTKRAVAMSSSAPAVAGDKPITFSILGSTNASGAITIDASTGVITASNTLSVGTYMVTVIAENSAGSTTFASAYTINITTNPDLVTFDGDIKPIIQGNCSPCHVAGGSQNIYENYGSAKGSINTIINRTNRTQGSSGFMPQNGTKLSAAQLALFEQWKTDGLLEN